MKHAASPSRLDAAPNRSGSIDFPELSRPASARDTCGNCLAPGRSQYRALVRILVVDDHRNTLVSMSIGLRRSGHTVRTAATASEALASLETSTFDCVVCDVRMQPTGGLELARAIRQRWPLAIVFMTAFHLNAAEKAVANDLDAPCLLKPIRVEALLDAIHAVTQ